MNHKKLLFLGLGLLLILQVNLMAEREVLPFDGPIDNEFLTNLAKPGGIEVGPTHDRGLHYGGRMVARDSKGILHISFSDANYFWSYYAHSLDTLGLTWSEPVYLQDIYGETWEYKCWMPKLAIDPVNDDVYLLPAVQKSLAVNPESYIMRSKDGGETWEPMVNLNEKLNRMGEEIMWGTMAIGDDQVLHIAYAKDNQDIRYTKANLVGLDDVTNIVFTKSDGVTVGDEAISYVPSGVVFQGAIVLDRNNDPHIIFSGDGGASTFGDKTPYHIYYKSSVQSWGPIPPVQLQAELEQIWGMPEIVFDKNNRGYYFLDGNGGGITFGTWEPPLDDASATDFGTLNATGEQRGFAAAVPFDAETFSGVGITVDDQFYLPQGGVDDANDRVYLAGNTGSRTGGDIFVYVLENASTYSMTTAPGDMDWQELRQVTNDGATLWDVGADLVLDPGSSHIDLFWCASGANSGMINYLDVSVPIPATDAKAAFVDYIIPNGKRIVNKGDVLTIVGAVANGGTNFLAPFTVTASVSAGGSVVFTNDFQVTPLLPGARSNDIEFGTWTVDRYGENISLSLKANYDGDEAEYNNSVGTSFFAYPDTLETVLWDFFDDYGRFTWNDETEEYDGWTVTFPVYKGSMAAENLVAVSDAGGWFPPEARNVGGWYVVDNAYEWGDVRDDYVSTWLLDDEMEANNAGAYVRHLMGIRGDTLYGDITPVGGMTEEEYAQPQDEMLYSPTYTFPAIADGMTATFEWDDYLSGTNSDVFPVYAWIEVMTDLSAEWQPVYVRSDTVGSSGHINSSSGGDYVSVDVTDVLTGASSAQFRFWWRNENNNGEFVVWQIDNVSLTVNNGVGVENNGVADTYRLDKNYPNPFNPTTNISFNLPEASNVKIEVFNVLGQNVATLVNGFMTSGQHHVVFDGADLGSGIYFYKMSAGDVNLTQKMLLLK